MRIWIFGYTFSPRSRVDFRSGEGRMHEFVILNGDHMPTVFEEHHPYRTVTLEARQGSGVKPFDPCAASPEMATIQTMPQTTTPFLKVNQLHPRLGIVGTKGQGGGIFAVHRNLGVFTPLVS